MRRLQNAIFEIGWSRTVPRLTVVDKVDQAVALMRNEAHDCVLVLRAEKLVGIFTASRTNKRGLAAPARTAAPTRPGRIAGEM